MPLPPLPEPTSVAARVRGQILGISVTLLLFSTLMVFNLAQTLSLAVRPFSGRLFRAFNRWAADTWWGWCVTFGKQVHRIRLVVTGDDVPDRENAIVIANHQQMTDITFLMFLAREKHRLGDMKWLVKDIIKYVPGVGWGMLFIDCIFVARDWASDRAHIERTFAHLKQNKIPLWLLSFPEGTRLTPAKLEKSRSHAEARGLPRPEHVLVPRSKGFVASVRGLAGHVAAVYDLTIGYVDGVPTLWQYVKGYARIAHLHVRRSLVSELPTDDDGLAAWLLERFRDKERLLADFYRRGAFPASIADLGG